MDGIISDKRVFDFRRSIILEIIGIQCQIFSPHSLRNLFHQKNFYEVKSATYKSLVNITGYQFTKLSIKDHQSRQDID